MSEQQGQRLLPSLSALPISAVTVDLDDTLYPQARFLAARGGTRGFWALVSVYLGATCFGASCGVLAAIRSGTRGGVRVETLLEPVVGVLWGVTLTGYLLFLWPLAYATHWWLEHRLE